MIRWFAKNHVAANILMLAILLGGGYLAYFKLPVEVEPSVTFAQVNVRVPLRGGSPKDVEQKVVLPVEQALQGLSGVDSIESEARRSSGSITVHAAKGVDLDKLKNDIESRIERINTFPQEAERPRVSIPNTANWHEVISVAIHGNLSEDDLIRAAKKVRDDLTSLDGISKVDIKGVRTREIAIEVKPEVLNNYNLTINDLSRKIREASVDLSAGSIENNGERIMIRSTSQAYLSEQFRDLVISRSNGSEIKLGDLATVKDSFENDRKIIRFNGEPCLIVEVLRLEGENALKTAKIVHNYVGKSHQRFPDGIHLSIWDDDSVSLKGRLSTLGINLLQGGILVLIVLGLFLRPKIAFWVVAGIPVSFAGSVIFMHLTGVTANNMSIFGFIIVLGIVVDDAIVTGENIYSRLRDGKLGSLDAAVLGTQEVATPVTFGMLTTIAAFVPLMFFDGYIGEMAKQIPLVVIPVLLFSLVESKLILPSHLKSIKTHREKTNVLIRVQRCIATGLEAFIEKVYKPALDLAISYRYITCAVFMALMMVTIGYYKKQDNFDASPSSDRYYILSSIRMISGTPFEETDKRVKQVVDGLDSIRSQFIDPGTGESLIRNVVTSSGGMLWRSSVDPTEGWILVEITPPSQRSVPGPKNAEIALAWEQAVGEISGVKSFRIRSEKNNSRGGRGGSKVAVMLRSTDDQARKACEDQLQDWLEKQEHITQAYSQTDNNQRELQVKLNAVGREANLSEDDLAKQVRTAFYGSQVQKFQRGDEEVRVMVKLPQEMRQSLHTLETLRVSLPGNQVTSISQFADIVEGTTPPRIDRQDGMRVTRVYANAKEDLKVGVIEPKLTKFLNELCQDYPSVSWSYDGEIADYKESNKRLVALAAILIFTLYSLLAIPFKSFLQPFLVMLAVPFGVIGAYWGHVIMGLDVSYLSYFGMLALAGVVVNDSLVIVDFINQKRLEGVSLSEAISQSGVRRFRPILLTSITTFAGLMPIMFESSIQAQFLIPMSVSLGFGILFATVITLFLIPCSYAISVDVKKAFGIKG